MVAGGIMYKHCDINDENISLHDCHVTQVLHDNGTLIIGNAN